MIKYTNILKKLIIGAIFGVILVFCFFSSKGIEPKATEITINPITSLDDIPIGAKITFNDSLTNVNSNLEGVIVNSNSDGSNVVYSNAFKYLNNTLVRGIRFNVLGGSAKLEVYTDAWYTAYSQYQWRINDAKVLIVNSNLYYWKGSTQDNSDSNLINWLNSNATITIEQTTPQVNITLDGNGGQHENGAGDINSSITISCDIGSVASSVNNSGSSWSRTGYSLVGWATSSSATTPLTNTELNAIETATTLYAIWRSNTTIQVSFQVNAPSGTTATGSVPNSEYVEQNSVYTLPGNTGNLSIPHYNFLGWSTYPSDTTGLTTYNVGTQNVIFFAIWQIETKTLTLNLGGGNLPGYTTNTFTYNYGTNVNLANFGTPVKTSFIFLGWGLTSDATEYISNISMTTNKTIYAIWGTTTQDLATITFNGNDATGGAVPGSVQVVKGTQYALPFNPGELVKTGFTFMGWGLTSDATTTITTITPNANITLYAVWVEQQFATITLKINGETIGTCKVYNAPLSAYTIRFGEFDSNYYKIKITANSGFVIDEINQSWLWLVYYDTTEKYGNLLYTFNGENIENIKFTNASGTTTTYDSASIDLMHYSLTVFYNNNDTYTLDITTTQNTTIDNFKTIVGGITETMQSLLDINIGWFSLGALVSIVLAVGVLFFVFKIARGGGNG